MSRGRGHGVRRGDKAWTKIVRRYESSGLSQQAFCRREGLVLSSLQRWRKRIRSGRDAGFVELVPSEGAPSPSTSSWSLELSLPNGASIRLQG